MKKAVVGASRPLSQVASGAAGHESLFFSYDGMGRQTNPVIRAAWLAPRTVPDAALAVQPMCGMECVSLLWQGAMRVRDSAGLDTRLAAGDALWHGTGAGVLREECPQAGAFEACQLWLNLPAQHKLAAPYSQHIASADIPRVALPDGAGHMRLLAGEWQGQLGPAQTVLPLQLWDITLAPGARVELPLPHGWYVEVLALQGQMGADYWRDPVRAPQMVLFDAFGEEVGLSVSASSEPARLVLIASQPLNEPISGDGALVMNTPEQLDQMHQQLAQGAFRALPDEA